MLLMKNSQFLPNSLETWWKQPSHGKVKLPKFQLNPARIVDFSLIAYFRACLIFYSPVSTRKRLSLLIFQVMRLDFLPYKLQLTKEKGLAVRKPFWNLMWFHVKILTLSLMPMLRKYWWKIRLLMVLSLSDYQGIFCAKMIWGIIGFSGKSSKSLFLIFFLIFLLSKNIFVFIIFLFIVENSYTVLSVVNMNNVRFVQRYFEIYLVSSAVVHFLYKIPFDFSNF